MQDTTPQGEGRNDRRDGAGRRDDGADVRGLEKERQDVLRRRRVIRAKLAQQAREEHKRGVVNHLPAHTVQITPGWKSYPVKNGSKLDIYRFEGTAETAIPRHKHPNHLEILYVVDGAINFRLGENDEMVYAGELQRIEPDIEHEIICASRTATLLSLFQPPICVEAGELEDDSTYDSYKSIFQKIAD